MARAHLHAANVVARGVVNVGLDLERREAGRLDQDLRAVRARAHRRAVGVLRHHDAVRVGGDRDAVRAHPALG